MCKRLTPCTVIHPETDSALSWSDLDAEVQLSLTLGLSPAIT
jgi:hypothetical protein